MKNGDVFQRDPNKVTLLNNGVAVMSDALTADDRRTLRFELEYFVCEGEYRRGLVRILESYLANIGRPEQPAVWISGFFGSGKSHLVKMLRYLWMDYVFPEDGASARGLANLPEDVADLFKEITTLGKREGGLHAASGTLGAGAGDSVRLSLLGMVFKSAGLRESYPQAQFCMYLRKNGFYEQVCTSVEADGRDFLDEINNLYVSPVIARALLQADPKFATDEREAKNILREQFPRRDDISNEEFVNAIHNVLTPQGVMPCTAIILDEVQQYIGGDASRSLAVQDVTESCRTRFGDRILFVATGQTALSGTAALQQLQGRFTVNIELSDYDVETVTRRVVLAKRADRVGDVEAVLKTHAGEIARQLSGTRIGVRSEDDGVLVEDYPLLPVRRRFWEQVLRAVDKAGMSGQLRTQLRIVYDAICDTADDPLGTVVPADFLFFEISNNLLNSGMLLREIYEVIRKQDDGTADGRLRARLCALVFLIRKLPREASVDIGVRATAEMLSDLLVQNLSTDGKKLRIEVPILLDALVNKGTLIKLDHEYSIQTRESSEWDAEFRNRQARLSDDLSRVSIKRAQLLNDACQKAISGLNLKHGVSREKRNLLLHFKSEPPAPDNRGIPAWIRDGWGIDENSVLNDAGAGGIDSAVIWIFIPKTQADALKKRIVEHVAALETLDVKGTPTSREGGEARDAMQTRLTEATNNLNMLIRETIDSAKVFQGGGNERVELSLADKVRAAAEASLDRLYPEFRQADDARWDQVIRRARANAEHPLEAIDFDGRTEANPVTATILAYVGSGKRGREVRSHFADAPYGWPQDAVDGALISLLASEHLRATHNGVRLKAEQLDQAKISVTEFRVESATIEVAQRLQLRKLYQLAAIPYKSKQEAAAAPLLLTTLLDLASAAGGEAPLPPHPNTADIVELQSLAGNEQLLAILARYDELQSNIEKWRKAKELADKRLPAWRNLVKLMQHAEGQPFAEECQPQIAAIMDGRRLLEPSDPVASLAKVVVDGLRATIIEAEAEYHARYDQDTAALQALESWHRLEESQRAAIVKSVGLIRANKGALGNEAEVLASLDRISLASWVTRTAALPQLFARAREQADKQIDPTTQHVRLTSFTLRGPEDVKRWVTKTEQDLLAMIIEGPVVVG